MLSVWNCYKHFLQKNLKMKSYKNKGELYERQKSFVFLLSMFINFHSQNSINFTNSHYFGKIRLCYKN
ncbi:hypothetical protein D7D53_00570 [Streptococcus gwangjuense]|uniref:Uncharacterized protein n=1 Tax=Streptococcus gwangjuensis TaxID=1433513 RepID=A0A387AVS3_9STRE|nr:hypothetical protein D7D53_00570 [Streptococcus gwangjuense]